jgi:hypothetical protein
VAPRTRQEDELMGEASDRLAEQAKQIGKEQLEKAQQVGVTPMGGDVTPKDPRLGTP